MSRLLVCTQTGRGTGFGRVAESIASSLAEDHEVHVVGLGETELSRRWFQHAHDELDANRISAVSRIANEFGAAVVILVGQGQLQSWQIAALRSSRYVGVIIAYVPVEGSIYNAAPLEGLLRCDAVVAYTEAGADELRHALQAITAVGDFQKKMHVISHAIDRGSPGLGKSRELLRAQLFPQMEHRHSGTWILNGNRNDHRKCPELSLQAFARVAAKHRDATLILHCRHRRRGLSLRIEIARLGLQNQVFITSDIGSEFLSEEQVSLLYASCEIGINSALGEGWGLVAFEHALFGAAQILPSHAGLREIWGSAPVWSPVAGKLYIDEVFLGQVPDEDATADSISRLLSDPAKLQQVGSACAAKARSEALTSAVIGREWQALVATVLRQRL